MSTDQPSIPALTDDVYALPAEDMGAFTAFARWALAHGGTHDVEAVIGHADAFLTYVDDRVQREAFVVTRTQATALLASWGAE